MKNCKSEGHRQETSFHYLFVADEEHSTNQKFGERARKAGKGTS